MTLPARAQTLVDELVQLLNLQTTRPSKIAINLDDAGLVQAITPKIVYRRKKGIDTKLVSSHP